MSGINYPVKVMGEYTRSDVIEQTANNDKELLEYVETMLAQSMTTEVRIKK